MLGEVRDIPCFSGVTVVVQTRKEWLSGTCCLAKRSCVLTAQASLRGGKFMQVTSQTLWGPAEHQSCWTYNTCRLIAMFLNGSELCYVQLINALTIPLIYQSRCHRVHINIYGSIHTHTFIVLDQPSLRSVGVIIRMPTLWLSLEWVKESGGAKMCMGIAWMCCVYMYVCA